MDDLIKKLRTPEMGWPGDAECVDGDVAAQAADEIERLTAEVRQCALELGEAAKLLQNTYPRVAGIYEEACGRARVAVGLTPCVVEQKASEEGR